MNVSIRKRIVLGSIAALGLCLVLSPAAYAVQTWTSYAILPGTLQPGLIDAGGGVYKLTDDIVFAGTSPYYAAISIQADGITLDGQGHKITMSGTSSKSPLALFCSSSGTTSISGT